MPLFRDLAGVAGVFALNEALPPFDVQCSLMSLPLAFRTDLARIPAQVPYLHARQDLVATWRQRLDRPQGCASPSSGQATRPMRLTRRGPSRWQH